MKQYVRLVDFICELIDIQIKKYVGLATWGVGPDAKLNAKLVYEEVNELFGFAETMLTKMIANEVNDDTFYAAIFNQVKFYIEQEYRRGQAGELLDKNNVHTTLEARVIEQLEELKEIAQLANIEFSPKSTPVTDVQHQCEHDTAQIAFFILDIAVAIRKNPEMELDDKVPEHAKKILRRNAIDRYVKLAATIDKLHEEYATYLENSPLNTSSSVMSKAKAELQRDEHIAKWENILQRYKSIAPDSKLFSPEHEWHKVGKATPASKSVSSMLNSRNLMLFSSATLFAGVLVGGLLPYCIHLLDNESATPTFD